MSEHDPLCHYAADEVGIVEWCDCALIAKVRAGERATPPPWALRCAICLHKPPGDRDITQADRAITVMAGHALCEEHIDLFTLPSDVEEWLLDERMKK